MNSKLNPFSWWFLTEPAKDLFILEICNKKFQRKNIFLTTQNIQSTIKGCKQKEENRKSVEWCASGDGSMDICLLRILQVINIKHGEQSRFATLSSLYAALVVVIFLRKNYIFLTAMVSPKLMVGRTQGKVQQRQRHATALTNLQRLTIFTTIDFSLVFLRVLSPIEALTGRRDFSFHCCISLYRTQRNKTNEKFVCNRGKACRNIFTFPSDPTLFWWVKKCERSLRRK